MDEHIDREKFEKGEYDFDFDPLIDRPRAMAD
jgi:hypothetical protein